VVRAYDDPGPADQAHPEPAHSHADDELLTWVQPADGDAVRVDTEDLDHVPVGATVSVTVGEPVPDEASAGGLEEARDVVDADVVTAPATEQIPAAQADDPANHLVTIVMMQPAGAARDATTLTQVQAAVAGPVATFWRQQSGGVVRMGLAATAVDWFQGTSTCQNPNALWAEAAARAGWTYGPGKHLLVYVPTNAPGCSYGLGEVRSNTSSGGQLYVQAAAAPVIAHELGHNFGLGHASELQCPGTVEGAACQVSAYRDYYDVMGVSWNQIGSLSTLNASQLGVLPASAQVAVTPSSPAATYTLAPLSGTTGTRALRLTSAGGAVYWLEYRTPTGQDAWLGDSRNWVGLQPGVLVRRVNTGSGDSSLLLDPTPSAADNYVNDLATVLPVGAGVRIGEGGLTVTVTQQTATGAVVSVVSGSPPRGSVDSVTLSGLALTMSGWAMDPDAPATSVPVRVSVDSQPTVVTADGARADIAAAFPGAGAAHGWTFATVLPEGNHTVCVEAIDVAKGPGNSSLGCRTVTAASRLPLGSIDGISMAGSTLAVRGWALDLDRATAPVQVHVYVDGGGTAVMATGSRPDVGAAFPAAGDLHGFAFDGSLTQGVHTVCVYAIDPDVPTRNTALGCRSISVGLALPLANWEVLSAAGSTVSVAGWALDPDQPTNPVQVHVYVDGGGTAVQADRSRPDLSVVFPGAGAAHGFSYSVALAQGVHTVCVYAIDPDVPTRNTALGCRSISVGLALPLANWEVLSAAASTVTVAGWALDPDQPTNPVQVHVYVDGGGTAVQADRSRPDLRTAFPAAGDAHGFSYSVALAQGVHTVCVYAIDPDLPTRNTALGCRSISVGLALPLANWEVLSAAGSTVTVEGWALDPDQPMTASSVHVYVDGGGTAVRADRSRPDLRTAFPAAGDAHGFSYSVALAQGVHTVCVYAIDIERPGLNTALGCRTIATR
jgi:hypothetical protein